MHGRLGVMLCAFYVFAHVLGQIHLMKLRIIMKYHGEFVRLVKFYGAFLEGKLQNMAALLPVIGNKMEMPAGSVQTAHIIRAVQAH